MWINYLFGMNLKHFTGIVTYFITQSNAIKSRVIVKSYCASLDIRKFNFYLVIKEVFGMDVYFQAVEPMEICSPQDHADFQAATPMEICSPQDHAKDFTMMDVDEIEDKMEVDEDVQDIRYLLDDGMNTQQQFFLFFRESYCQNVEMKYQTKITSRDQRIDHLNGQLQNTEMLRDSEISKLRQHCVNVEMNFKKSESCRMEFESEISMKNEKIVFLSSQLELKSSSIGELMSDQQRALKYKQSYLNLSPRETNK